MRSQKILSPFLSLKSDRNPIRYGALVLLTAFCLPISGFAEASLQKAAIFGVQSDPDYGGRGPGFPVVETPNTDYCVANCGYLANDGYGNPSKIDLVEPIEIVEANSGLAAEWAPAYLSGDHPWGVLCLTPGFPLPPSGNPCTNSWLNYRSNDISVLLSDGLYASIRYRVRFYVPNFPEDEFGNAIDASMIVKMKVDNWGKTWINGVPIPAVIWGDSTVNGSAEFASAVRPGLNIIELVVGDGGGLAGFTYLIELTMQAEGPITEVPSGEPEVLYSWVASGFGQCSASCGGGVSTQDVTCVGSDGSLGTDADCGSQPKPPTSQSCNENPCPVDCQVSEFGAFSECSASCGGGTQTRTRTILVANAHGGAECPDLSHTQACNTHTCDSDGDGVDDDGDACPGTAGGAVVNGSGCSGAQNVAAACPTTGAYKNHGAYVSCVAHACNQAVAGGLLTLAEKDAIVSAAGQSGIGKKK